MSKYLVTGGAGFVGSHLVALLLSKEHQVTVLDNLSTGHRKAAGEARFVEGNIGNGTLLGDVLSDGPWDAVFHFAALSLVGESMTDPLGYFRNNTALSGGLIEECVRNGVPKFIFSSTAALFGNPPPGLIGENAPVNPLSPYGESKHMVERMLDWADRVHGLKSACLRYFNAAGSDPDGKLGEDHNPETHLIPLVIDAALSRRNGISIFGTDYPTPDGTAVRDYVHVSDLARAHLAAAEIIGEKSVKYNLGTGTGVSVSEIINSVSRVSGRRIPTENMPRRAGDPPSLVADPQLIRSETGWQPRFVSIDSIVETALQWREAHPHGYR